MRTKRYALYMHSMFGGGAERVFALISSELARMGCAIDLVMNRAEGPNMAFIDPAVRVIDLRCATAAAPIKLYQYLRRERPAAIVGGLNNNNLIALIAARAAGVPIAATVHHIDALHGQDCQVLSPAGRVFNASGPLIYRLADAVGGVSQMVLDGLPKGAAPAYLIYNPVDMARFRLPEAPRPVPPLILGVGRLTRAKNFQHLIRAFAVLAQHRPAHVAILGEGPERANLEGLAAALGVADRVSLQGYVADPVAWYQKASVLVSCSTNEGFGNAMAEAMACGAPVVACDEPGPFREVLGPFAQLGLVKPGDPAALAARIEQLLDHPPDPHALRAQAETFALDRCARRYLDMLHAIERSSAERRRA